MTNPAVGEIWKREGHDTEYRVVHTDTFIPKDRKPAVNGARLATPGRSVRATLQTTKPILYGTKLVVFVSAKQPDGKHWVRSLDEFLADFTPTEGKENATV